MPKKSILIRKAGNRKPRLLFLFLDLLFGVAFDLARRFSKSWIKSLKQEQNRSDSSSRRSGQPVADTPSVRTGEERQKSEPPKAVNRTSSPARLVDLLKDTTTEWIRDKCPQLGAALAYNTVFSLAPLMLVVLALLSGSTAAARMHGKKFLNNCSTSWIPAV